MIIFFGFFSCWYSTRSPLLLNELKQCWIFSIDVNYQVKNFIILQKFQLWSLTKYNDNLTSPAIVFCQSLFTLCQLRFSHIYLDRFLGDEEKNWRIGSQRCILSYSLRQCTCNLQLIMYIYKNLFINRRIVKFFSKHSLDLFDNVNSICISCFFYLNSKRKKHFLFFCWYKKNACILLPTWKQFEPF